MISLKTSFIFSFIFSLLSLLVICDGRFTSSQREVIRMDIPQDTLSDSKYTLRLSRPEKSVLHPNIKVIRQIGRDNDDQFASADTWSPSNYDLGDVEGNIYLDDDNLAAVRLAFDEEQGRHVAMNGVVNGKRIKEGRLSHQNDSRHSFSRTDYIDIGRRITRSKSQDNTLSPVIVEVLLVCDKEFGDVFNHDRRKILDYFTVYFWDINLRFKTLPSSNIAFRITGIIIINSPGGQPFIEEARASDGRAEFGRILSKFRSWVYGRMSSVPKFDMAIAITNTRLEWRGGLAYLRSACLVDNHAKANYATMVWSDAGDWGSVRVGAHECAHNLGAPHDDDTNYPGGCKDRGYIMSGGHGDLKWFFSTCSDRTISKFVRSKEASCLRRLDETTQPTPISPDLSAVSAPSMQEQCQRRLKKPKAFIREEDTSCKNMKCWAPNDNGNEWLIWNLDPVDNTPCRDGGRCFRGRCRKIGSTLMHVGSGKCARAQKPFSFMAPLEMTSCPNTVRGATPLDKFVVEDSSSKGKFFKTPYSSPDGKENGDKCVFTGNKEGDALWTNKCNLENSWQGWNMVDVKDNQEFMLQHKVTGRCAKPKGGYIRSYKTCNSNDKDMRWRLV